MQSNKVYVCVYTVGRNAYACSDLVARLSERKIDRPRRRPRAHGGSINGPIVVPYRTARVPLVPTVPGPPRDLH
jgi:hypothetical protein